MLVLKPPGGPLLLWGILWGALQGPRSRRGFERGSAPHPAAGVGLPRGDAARIVASGGLALALAFLARSVPGVALCLFLAALAAGALRQRAHWFLAVWAFIGVLLFLATPEKNASYTRHLVVPCVLLAAVSLAQMAAMVFAALPAVRRLVFGRGRLEWLSFAATAAFALLIAAAARFPIPGLASRIQQVRYVGDLGLAFRDVLSSGLRTVPQQGEIAFFAGRSREDEMRSLYGADYFARLQPAKDEHYDDFVAMLGRRDVRVQLVDPESGTPPAGVPLVAVNGWELQRAAELCRTAPLARVQRGRAEAAVFRTPSP
jgi:hypothetical protein